QRLSSFDAEIFYFDRQNTLEFIGTSLEDKSDIDDFINGENGSTQYQKFFQYIYEITTDHEIVKEEVALANSIETGATIALEQSDQDLDDERVISSLAEGLDVSIQDKILNEVKGKLPNLYAENIKYSDEYINNYFYFRPCMEDLFIPEKSILLGDKGTGKTAFYKALQYDSFFQMLISKAQKTHLDYNVLNVTNFDDDNFEFLGFDEHVRDELFIKRFW
ncbi:hypothetical protein, partial [Pseudomonas viridiflava]|uniref:hypothetical protein n=1 Tax=Pseudomonas viridiflava TaxID=33069 RepID=UPI001F12259A